MANIALLKAELAAGHPDTGDYDADSVAAAAQGNLVNRTQNRATMTASEVYNEIVPAEYTPLSVEDKAEVWNIIHLGTLNPFGLEATRLTDIFGAGSATIAALKAARKTDVSRFVEIGVGSVWPGEVTQARAYHG